MVRLRLSVIFTDSVHVFVVIEFSDLCVPESYVRQCTLTLMSLPGTINLIPVALRVKVSELGVNIAILTCCMCDFGT